MKKKICLLFVYFPLMAAAVFAAETKKPNVLFIGIDDLNDWVGCYGGYPNVKTPNLDRLNAEGGIAMMNAYAVSTLCNPSRSALLSGRFPHSTGIYLNNVNVKDAPKLKNIPTLPQYFSQHGYYTLSRGKIFHAHYAKKSEDTDYGQWAFDEWVAESPEVETIGDERPLNHLIQVPNDNHAYHMKFFDWGPTKGNDETKMRDYVTASWAAEQLTTRKFEKPFFMAVGINRPHLTWFVPQKYFDMYPLDEIQLPATIPDDRLDIVSTTHPPKTAEEKENWYYQSTWRRLEKSGRHKEAVQAYLACVTFVDDCIGVILDGLKKSPYADNTIIMLWSDHGYHLGQKQRYGKAMLWKEACHIPLMVKVPGVTKNNVKCDGLVSLIDMYPTLVDLCGLPENPDNEGRSFAELIKNPKQKWDKPILSDYRYTGHRVFDGRYSYIVFKEFGTEELYDLQEDPNEWKNLVNDPDYAGIKERLIKLVPTEVEPQAVVKK